MKGPFRLPFSRTRARAEAGDEVRFHLEGRIDELVASGMSRTDAEREATRRFGDPLKVEAEVERIDVATENRRAIRERVGDALRDLRISARSLARNPGFSIAVVTTLALGIGANTAIFSVADALLFRPPPYVHPEQLASIWPAQTHPAGEFFALRDKLGSFAQVGTYSQWQMTVGNEAGSFRADGADVSDSLFALLGVGAAIGRTFEPGSNVPGTPRVAILSHALWQSRFGGDSAAVGRSLLFEGVPRTIIGVMPEDFAFPEVGTELWIPSTFTPDQVGNHWGWWKYSMVGRLKAGIEPGAASREIASVARGLRRANPLWDPGSTYGANATIVSWQAKTSGPARTTMLVLMGVVFALLLVACANVANLVLVRSMAREREFAVRAALGSSRARMVMHMLGENFILVAGGGAAAVALAWSGVRGLSAALPRSLSLSAPIAVDVRVLGFTFLLVLFCWLAVALWPALRAASPMPGGVLTSARGSSRGTDHRRLAGALTVIQLALAVVLVTASGLLLRSLDALRHADAGIRPERVLAARVTMPTGSYRDSTRRSALTNALLARVRAEPGMDAVGIIDRPPLRGPVYGMGARIEGVAEDMHQQLPSIQHAAAVSPGYFGAMGIRILSGRDFTDEDGPNAPWTVVISKSMADRFWPGADPIGRHVGLPFPSQWMTVVGVAADVKQDSVNAARDFTLYRPLAQATQTDLTIVARSSATLAAFGAAVRLAVGEIDRTVPVSDVRTMESIVSASMGRAQFTAVLLTSFALLALILGAVGIYGVVSYTVAQRTREMGVRIALGATPRRVLGLVLGRGAALAGLGVTLGLAGAFAGTRTLSGLLYGVSVTDALTFGGAPILLLAVALTATWLPARRAARLSPVDALRRE